MSPKARVLIINKKNEILDYTNKWNYGADFVKFAKRHCRSYK